MSITIGSFIQSCEDAITAAGKEMDGITYDTPIEFVFGDLNNQDDLLRLQPENLAGGKTPDGESVFILQLGKKVNGFEEVLSAIEGVLGKEKTDELRKQAEETYDLQNGEVGGNA